MMVMMMINKSVMFLLFFSFFRKYRDLWFIEGTSLICAFQKYKERHENIFLSFLLRSFQSSPVALLSITQEFSWATVSNQLVVLSIWFSKPFSSNTFSYQATVRHLRACVNSSSVIYRFTFQAKYG